MDKSHMNVPYPKIGTSSSVNKAIFYLQSILQSLNKKKAKTRNLFIKMAVH
jgi:hypothetical protein